MEDFPVEESKPKHPGGRPVKTIDWEQFDKLCFLQCTRKEIAAFFDVNDDTIEAICQREKNISFSGYYEQKSAGGKISLRRRQYKLADSGNATMLIWLGKQWLGQSDQISIADDGKPPVHSPLQSLMQVNNDQEKL